MSSSVNVLLQSAIAAHRAGRLEEADRLYAQVLQRVPAEPRVLYLRGLVFFHRGQVQEAVQSLRHSLAREPRHVRAWLDLGGMLMAEDRLEEARDAYQEATVQGPEEAAAWYNLGVCLSRLGNPEAAIAQFRQGLRLAPDACLYEPLAQLLYRSGDLTGAAQIYEQWSAAEPDNPRAIHMAAAARGTAPPRAPDAYIRAHFDAAAEHFDRNLEQLRYRAPQLVAQAFLQWAPAGVEKLLDAGCGTGLCGPLVRPHCRQLIGLDLSAAMLARAALRGCYDALHEAELTGFLQAHPDSFDAVLCVDTLVYFGELTPPLSAARAALRPEGWLLFTVEAGSGRMQLALHGRYTHSEPYLRQCVAQAGLTLVSLSPGTLREERGEPVAGYLVAARA